MNEDYFKSNGSKTDGFFKTFKTHFNQQDLSDIQAYSFFSKMNGSKLPNKFFRPDGICIGKLSDGSLIYLPHDHFQRHTSVSGKTGAGKTTLITRLFLQLFALSNSVIVVMDKGDLGSKILDRIDTRLDDIILVRVSDTEYPVSINLLQLAHFRPETVISEIVRILNLVSTDRLSDRMVLLLRRCILALLNWDEANMADIEIFLFSEKYRNQVLSKVNDPELNLFWKERYPKDEKNFRSSAEGIVTRLEQIIGDPIAKNFLCQSRTNIPFNEIAKGDRRLVLLLDLNTEGKVSSLVADLIARVFLVIIHGLCLSRPFNNAKPVFLMLDECQTYCEPTTLSEILSRGAKYHTHLALSFQYLDQLRNLYSAIEGNAGTVISFSCGAEDASRLARSFPGRESSEFVELPRFQTLVRVNDEAGVFSFKTSTFPVPDSGRNFRDQIVALSRQKYTKPRAEVEAEFQKRRELMRSQNNGKADGSGEFVENLEPLI